MFTNNAHNGSGMPSFRDETYKDRSIPLGARSVSYAHLVKSIEENAFINRDNSTGDILGSVLVKPSSRGMSAWFHACPAVKTQYGFFPIRDSSFAPDTSFEPIDAAVPNGAQIPNGTPVIILCATKEDGEQELLVMSGGSGAEQPALSLIAANRNPPFEMGTSVYDLNDKGEIDINVQAKLQSAWKVMVPNYSPKSGTTVSQNFFNLAAQAKGFPSHDDQRTLLKITPKNNNGNKVNVGILPDGAGGLNFSKGGKQIDPFTLFGINNKNKLKFTDPDPNGNVVNVGVGVNGGLNFGAPQPSNAGFGNTPGVGFLFNPKYQKPKITS